MIEVHGQLVVVPRDVMQSHDKRIVLNKSSMMHGTTCRVGLVAWQPCLVVADKELAYGCGGSTAISNAISNAEPRTADEVALVIGRRGLRYLLSTRLSRYL